MTLKNKEIEVLTRQPQPGQTVYKVILTEDIKAFINLLKVFSKNFMTNFAYLRWLERLDKESGFEDGEHEKKKEEDN